MFQAITTFVIYYRPEKLGAL